MKDYHHKSKDVLIEEIRLLTKEQEELRRDRELLYLILDHTTSLISYVDRNERYQFVNHRYSEWFNIDREKVQGTTVKEMVGEEFYPPVHEMIQRALHGETVRYDGEVKTVDGEVKIFNASYIPHRGGKGEIDGLIAYVHDITTLKKAQREVEVREKRLNEAQAIAQVGSWERSPRTGEVFWSDEMFRLLGYEPGEVEPSHERVMAQLGEEETKRLYAIMEEAEARHAENFEFKGRYLRRGSQQTRYCHITAAYEYDENGIIRIRGIFQDITESILQEQALSRLTRAIEQSPVAVVITDINGVIEYINPFFSKHTGYTPDEVIGKTPRILKSGAHRDEYYHSMWKTIIDGRIWQGELCNLRKDGSEYWADCVIAPVEDEDGRVVQFVAVQKDITMERQMEKMKEDMERLMRHDLKGPLNAVISVPQLLKATPEVPDSVTEMLDLVEQAGYRMLSLINMSLDLYKMEAGIYPFSPAPVDILDIMKNVNYELASLAERMKVTVECVMDGHKPGEDDSFMIDGEELLCHSMLSNLLSNAIEASPEGEKVTVSYSSSGRPVLTMHNKGTVPVDIRGRFFDKYVSAGKTNGTGLGTYSAKLIADVHGAEISMHSNEQEGTTVTLVFPEPRASGEK